MDVEALRTRWHAVDERLADLWPDTGQVTRSSEHVRLDGRFVTRTLQVVMSGVDPMVELERLVNAPRDLTIAVDDCGVIARARGLTARAHGDPRLGSFELLVELESEADDVDLRAEVDRYPAFEPIAAIVELGVSVNRIGWTEIRGRSPNLSFSIAIDDESRHGLLAWLAAKSFVRHGTTWTRDDHVVAFERADELGVDEVTAFIDPTRRPRLARGTRRDLTPPAASSESTALLPGAPTTS